MGLADAVHSLLSSSSLRRTAVAAAVALPLLALATPALAAPAPAGAAAGPAAVEAATAGPRAATAGPHCTLGAGEKAQLRCFTTFPAAVAFATGGRVTSAPASPAAAMLDPAFTAAVNAPGTTAASYLVGIEYADLNFGGGTLSLYANGRCDTSSDADYRFASMQAGWNDRITSFKSYNNCAQQLFNGVNFVSPLTIVVAQLSYVGAAANDKASSLTFN